MIDRRRDAYPIALCKDAGAPQMARALRRKGHAVNWKRVRQQGAPRRTRPHPTCSPNAEKPAATGPPAHVKAKLPFAPGDP